MWRANGYSPVRVSNFAIEYALSTYSTVADAIGSAYQEAGHTFYVLVFPTANATWVYDVSNGLWSNRGKWNPSSSLTQPFAGYDCHQAMFHAFCFGKHLVGNLNEDILYKQAISLYDDNGSAKRWLRRSPVISLEHELLYHSKLEVLLEPGLGPIPPLSSGTVAGYNPSSLCLESANGTKYLLTIDDAGTIGIAAGGTLPTAVVLTDASSHTTSWQLGVTDGGVSSSIQQAYDSTLAQSFPMITSVSGYQTGLTVNASGVLSAIVPSTGARGPQIMVRASNDFAKTWGNETVLDCGQAGRFNQRIIMRRIGRSRARVYEISGSDAVAWHIVDAYVDASPGYAPSQRLSERIMQSA